MTVLFLSDYTQRSKGRFRSSASYFLESIKLVIKWKLYISTTKNNYS